MSDQGVRAKRKVAATRVYVLMAREARTAVVLRRGPSRRVMMLSWNLADDTLQPGQWLKGRVYERRCDLSPDGELLVYFTFRRTCEAWTAVSRPPFFTALALWRNDGAWGGGGLFETNNTLRLNHRPGPESELARGFVTPAAFQVHPLGATSGYGEDYPIYDARLERDGWRVESEGEATQTWSQPNAYSWTMDPPHRRLKPAGGKLQLQISWHGIGERNGTWYVETAQLVTSSGELVLDLGRIDWADVDSNGDVLFSSAGSLHRLRPPRPGQATQPQLVADLRGLVFEPEPPPDYATVWPKSAHAGRSSASTAS